MDKVLATVADALMPLSDHLAPLGAFWRPLGRSAQTVLGFRQGAFIAAEESGILNVLTRRQRGEVVQAHIHPNTRHLRRDRHGLSINRKAGEPLARRGAADGQGFDLTNDGAVKFNLDRADLREVQASILQPKAQLRVGEAVIPPLATKPRIASFFAT